MSLCALCGLEIRGGNMMCAHHARGEDDRWAENNRCMCDLLHRGRVPPRLPAAEREGECYAEIACAEVA
jgi:hypothetical protein